MFIKRLWKTNEYDVFVGNGWDNWIRVKYDPETHKVERVKGTISLTESLSKQCSARIQQFGQHKKKPAA